MRQTFNKLCEWPLFQSDEELPRPWLEMCVQTLQVASTDIEQLHASAAKFFSRPILSGTQFDDRLWVKPRPTIGSVLLIPSDAYFKRTHQPTLAELRDDRGPGIRTCGLELEFEIMRGYTHPQLPADKYFLPAIYSQLNLRAGRELNAFRDIYDDYRGIIRKLCDWAKLQFSIDSVISEVEAVRSNKPVPKLDVLLHAKDPDPDEQGFHLEYVWYPSTSFEDGLRAFAAQAILFTCIQKAAISERARRDYLLDFWGEVLHASK